MNFNSYKPNLEMNKMKIVGTTSYIKFDIYDRKSSVKDPYQHDKVCLLT